MWLPDCANPINAINASAKCIVKSVSMFELASAVNSHSGTGLLVGSGKKIGGCSSSLMKSLDVAS